MEQGLRRELRRKDGEELLSTRMIGVAQRDLYRIDHAFTCYCTQLSTELDQHQSVQLESTCLQMSRYKPSCLSPYCQKTPPPPVLEGAPFRSRTRFAPYSTRAVHPARIVPS